MICAGIIATLYFAVAILTLYSTGAEAEYNQTDVLSAEAQTAIMVSPSDDTSRQPENMMMEETVIWSRDWSEEDSEILLQIAMAEAEGESTEGKALVMLVVLNRAWSDGFPDSIEDVVFQKLNGVYQFSPVEPGGRYWTTEPNEDCYRALDMVMNGWDESRGALYFDACTGESWHSRNLEYLYTVGGHRFYK